MTLIVLGLIYNIISAVTPFVIFEQYGLPLWASIILMGVLMLAIFSSRLGTTLIVVIIHWAILIAAFVLQLVHTGFLNWYSFFFILFIAVTVGRYIYNSVQAHRQARRNQIFW